MARAASLGIGADIVIVVNSSDTQASFWQERLTGDDGVHGSGVVLKKDAIVLSVSEALWDGEAGNGFGTLNGFVEAAMRAGELGVLDMEDGLDIEDICGAMLSFSSGKTVFMFHNAGKGTRVSPLPAAEANSKPNIRLPGMITVTDTEGTRSEPMTMLEAVLRETSVYAPSRKERLCVFWGDQVILNEENIDNAPAFPVEIFGEVVPLNEGISSYGVLLPREDGGIAQREKLPLDEVRKLLPPGSEEVCRSIGSFTVSFGFLEALISMPYNLEALKRRKGRSDTDPDWWQPLTSERREYIGVMRAKGVPPEEAGSAWDRMKELKEEFFTRAAPETTGKPLVGASNVGRDSYWWDYGQNRFYLRNTRLLTSDSLEGRAARVFFGVAEDKWTVDSETGPGFSSEDSVIIASGIKRGSVKNCVIIDSEIEEVYAEDSVVIGSRVIDLKAYGSLCYGVAAREVNLMGGKVLAHVFVPGERLPVEMRTDIARDGTKDWKAREGKGAFVYDNLYTYPEIARMMSNATIKDVRKARNIFENGMRERAFPAPSARVKELSSRRGVPEEEARMAVARRMLAFGDVSSFTARGYAEIFDIQGPCALSRADRELKRLTGENNGKEDHDGEQAYAKGQEGNT
ncbi:MAG: hypothetical protein GF408_03855 [Candidatus Omnitrophica bacterium]|nr:hypothetical protein [Candidatus Omnitrophota bacterium]